MIKNVIFDMGNVLIAYDVDYIAGHFTDDPAERALLCQAIFCSKEWAMLDRGDITETEMRAAIAAHLPGRLVQTGKAVFDSWHLYYQRIPRTEALVPALRAAGLKLYLLSNASLRWYDYQHLYPAMDGLDGYIISASFRTVKPEPAIYRALFDRFSLKPEECFFVDDMPANIEGAKQMGMDGFVLDHFQYDALEETLRARGLTF